jgi:hypothetical protein
MNEVKNDHVLGHDGHDHLNLVINGVSYEWKEEFITGSQIRELNGISHESEIFLAIKRPWEDELITDETRVNLARPEIEHFYSKDKPLNFVLMVNGREKPWTQRTISFEQAVVLAFGSYDNNPNKVYTITYDRGPHENPDGSMVRGNIVVVKNKMIFNVTATDKS